MFPRWDGFYMLLGSASAGLIGLVFIVVTLTSGFDRARALRGSSRFMTPTVLQFAVVVLVSAIASAPVSAGLARLGLAVVALGSLFHAARNSWRMFGGDGEPPAHWSDPWTYGAAPAVAYAILFAVGAAGWTLGVGIMALVILLCGVRNAWDLITWIAPMRGPEGDAAGGGGETTPPPG